ncbi:MAG: hypothetical protein LIP23_00645 [Planctomycetes bacterium]|nr:hypothetical protein [Planctomycetota bacterium]
MKQVLQAAGYFVVKGVSKSLGLLVTGAKPGPKKIRLAKEYGTKIVSREDFLEMLESGGSPENLAEKVPTPDCISISDHLKIPKGVFLALDFETADSKFDSACVVGVVRVEDGVVTEEKFVYIRPPRERVRNTNIHGLDWKFLSKYPPFHLAWNEVASIFESASYIIAHNAYFDRTVLETCCRTFNINPPAVPFICTLRGAKKVLGGKCHSLNDLCERYSILLDHHHALSDAKAALKVFEALINDGLQISPSEIPPIQHVTKPAPLVKERLNHLEIAASKEFKVITEALLCDEILTVGEFDYICQWLAAHDDLAESETFQPVFELASDILRDGMVTDDERNKMLELLSILFTD